MDSDSDFNSFKDFVMDRLRKNKKTSFLFGKRPISSCFRKDDRPLSLSVLRAYCVEQQALQNSCELLRQRKEVHASLCNYIQAH